MGTIPFGNTIDIIMIKGKNLKSVLEHSAKGLVLKYIDGEWEVQGRGGFLQVSGMSIKHCISLFSIYNKKTLVF